MKNKEKYIENVYEKYIFFWLDELEFNVSDIKTDFIFYNDLELNLDQDNSSFAYIEIWDLDFMYKKIFVKWYDYWIEFLTSIDDIPVPCFTILFWKENKIWKSKDKVVIYSSFFVLEYLEKLPFTIKEFILSSFINPVLYRLDLALDLPLTIKELQETFYSWIKFFSAIWEDKKHPEFHQTYYIKNPQNSQNRKYIIRIYDKILDTFKKKKQFLYPHLENNNDVRRIELELRPIECERLPYTIEELLDNKNKCLKTIYFSYFNKNINPDYILLDPKIDLKKYTNQKINLQEIYLKEKHIPKDYITRVYWYIRNIFTSTWYNGLFQTIFNLKFVSWYEIKQQRTILSERPNYEFITQFLENLIDYLLKYNLISERKIRTILKTKLQDKTKINLKFKK